MSTSGAGTEYWIPSILFYQVSPPASGGALQETLFSPYILEFLLGTLLALVAKGRWRPRRAPLVAVFLIGLTGFLFLKLGEHQPFPFSQNLVFSVAVAALVLLTVLHWHRAIDPRSLWMLLGNSSYSLYLLHNPLQSALTRLVPRDASTATLLLSFVAVIALIGCLSYAYYWVVEKRLLSLLKQRLLPTNP